MVWPLRSTSSHSGFSIDHPTGWSADGDACDAAAAPTEFANRILSMRTAERPRAEPRLISSRRVARPVIASCISLFAGVGIKRKSLTMGPPLAHSTWNGALNVGLAMKPIRLGLVSLLGPVTAIL